MLNYLEILDRANDGPYLPEESWDLEKVAATTKRLVRKHRLEWNREEIITSDPSLVDAVFQAGFELAVELGAYCRSTERIITLSQEELENGMRQMPQSLVMGEGKDARTLYARRVGDERPPLFFGGSPGSPVPERSVSAQRDFLHPGAVNRPADLRDPVRGGWARGAHRQPN